jgi:small-conductance mechanosensitive channel
MKEFFESDFFTRIYYHNTVLDYAVALGIMVFGLLIVRIFKRTILQRLRKWTQKTNNNLDDFVFDSLDRFGIPWLYLTVVYIALQYLTLHRKTENIIKIAFTVAFTFLIIRLFATIIMALVESYVRKQDRGTEKVKQLGGLMIIVNGVIWIIGLLFLFDNMGYSVTTIVTGLGIGGIAVALAAQNILGDLFNYFVIFFDRPFETGDFIVVDEKSGTVDYIGIKTTRVQSLTGEQLIFANSDLTGSRIHNYKRMSTRRVSFKLRVIYQTSLEDLRTIPALLKSIVEEQHPVNFDRAHFASYGESSLDFEVVYNVLDTDFNRYMDIHQAINLRIFEEFQKRNIELAYPTRTVFTEPGATHPDSGKISRK